MVDAPAYAWWRPSPGAPPTVGSLFSGIGGLELGLEACGLGPVIWQVEHDPFCRSILARHYPGAARAVHDVRAAGAANLSPVDVLCAGFPCQPVSLAGERRAQEDERWLWPEVARIAGELGCPVLFLENVPGLLTADDGRAFGEVLGSLASLGYAAEWDCFRASDVGAPHRRERWFLLAYHDRDRRQQSQGIFADVAGWTGDGAQGRGMADATGARLEGSTRNGGTGEGGLPCIAPGGGSKLAHALRPGLQRPDARSERARLRATRRGGEALADAGGVAPLGGQPERVRGSAVPSGAVARGEGVGDPARERRRPWGLPVRAGAQQPVAGVAGSGGFGAAQPRVGRGPHGIPLGLDGPWPAGRGEAQHPWEPPRTAHGVRMRPARLKALGNAVLPAEAALAWRVLWARVMERMKGRAA